MAASYEANEKGHEHKAKTEGKSLSFFFLRKYINSKRMHNRTCLWIPHLAKMKIVFKKKFDISL